MPTAVLSLQEELVLVLRLLVLQLLLEANNWMWVLPEY